MNKYINKEAGINAISSYKRAFNIVESAKENLSGRPDAVLFRKDEERVLHEKINEMVNKIINFRMLDGPKGITSLSLKDSNEEVLIVLNKGTMRLQELSINGEKAEELLEENIFFEKEID